MIAAERFPIVRADGLNNHPADDGCEFSASCLTCPLPECKWDDPTITRTFMAVARALEVRQLIREGLSSEEIAARLGVSARTVQRDLRQTVRTLLSRLSSRRNQESSSHSVRVGQRAAYRARRPLPVLLRGNSR